MQFIIRLLTIVCLLLTVNMVFSQKSLNSSSEIDKYFNEALKNKSYYLNSKVLNDITTDKLLKTAIPFLAHKESFVRYKAIDLIKRKGLSENSLRQRQRIVSILVEACKERDSGNSGFASKALTLFALDDFTESAKDSLSALLLIKPYHFETIIKLTGFTQSQHALDALKTLGKEETKLSKKEEWAVSLALARMGNEQSIEYCMGKARSIAVNDNAVYNLFPDLIYIHQKESIDYLLQEIQSDEKKCHSSNPDKEESIICAFKIMELVAPVIIDFPLKVTSYGELEIDDYDEASIKVREWIKSNRSYTINYNTY